ncbi:MAG: PAS domain-containing protein [Burkholderiaceae bacterium]
MSEAHRETRPQTLAGQAASEGVTSASAVGGLGDLLLGPVFEAVFQASSVPQCLLDSEGSRILAVNDAWVRLTGVARKSALEEGPAVYGDALVALLKRGARPCGPDDDPALPTVVLGGRALAREVRIRASQVPTASSTLNLLEVLGRRCHLHPFPLLRRVRVRRVARATKRPSCCSRPNCIRP